MRDLAWHAPFLLQGLCMCVDEGWFHRRRHIPVWERVGHPLDTLTVWAFNTYLIVTLGMQSAHVVWAIGLAVLSCLFVTKDEWVHADLCTPGEHQLHAILFVLHPVVLFAMWHFYTVGDTRSLMLQNAVLLAFMGYQVARGVYGYAKS